MKKIRWFSIFLIFAVAGAALAAETANRDLFDRIDRGYVDEGAVKALHAAAEAGSGPAAQRLGYLYLSGRGLEINLPMAYRWYLSAALHNVPFAIDHASKILYRMSPSARVLAEDLAANSFTSGELAKLQAMVPASVPVEEANPGADKGSMVK